MFGIKLITTAKDGAYIINLKEYKLVGTHWIAIYIQMIIMQHILIVLELNVFQKKIKSFYVMKIS